VDETAGADPQGPGPVADRRRGTGYAVVVLPPPPPLRQPGRDPAGAALVRSLGYVRISGYLLRWVDGAARPLVVHGHGYGDAARPGGGGRGPA
jgi:hypothetical protein